MYAGFLTDDLTIHDDPSGSSKYLGVCILPGENRKVCAHIYLLIPEVYICVLVVGTSALYALFQ